MHKTRRQYLALARTAMLLALGWGVSWTSQAGAATLELSAVRQGSYLSSGTLFTTGNYQVGDPHNPAELIKRNFFVFDLSSVSDPIASAELRLPNPGGGGLAGYNSGDPTEIYEVHQVLTSTALVGVASGAGIYAELGDGPAFGSHVVSDANDGTDIAILLNPAGLAEVQATSGELAFGGLLTTLDGTNNVEYLFGSTSSGFIPKLVLVVVPEPSVASLLTVGIVTLALRRRLRSAA